MEKRISKIIYEKDDEKNESLLEQYKEIDQILDKKKQFKVHIYDDMCESFSKIDKILALKISSYKVIPYYLLNIITIFLINLIFSWYPRLKMKFLFVECGIDEATHFAIFGSDLKFYLTVKEQYNLPDIEGTALKRYCFSNIENKIILFNFKLFNYIYVEKLTEFISLKFIINTTTDNIQKYFMDGLNEMEVEHQRQIFGECNLKIKVDSVLALILKEITDPFYIFEIFAIILWFYNEYEKYATVILVATVLSIAFAIYETRTNLLNIQKMANYSCDLGIFRINKVNLSKSKKGEKELLKCKSTNLVPGDMFELPNDDWILPCDAILINGTVIVNESMLTGESIPVIKTHIITKSFTNFNSSQDKSHILYCGTKILQKRSIGGRKVMALVISTSFNTEKGNLIRTILYPKDTEYRFQKDSVKYILFMGFLAMVGLASTIPFEVLDELPIEEIVLRGLDLITTTVPPALPACLGIGISYAISRLKKKGITCINRGRVNIIGKVNMICFDKTGTLTEDHLDIYGYRPIKIIKNSFFFENFLENIDENLTNNFNHYREKMLNSNNPNWKSNKNNDINSFFMECLATCHSLTKVNGKIIGDPIDIRMFESTGWVLNENLENEENYDSLISTFVRPGNEKDLQEKLSQDGVDEDLILRSHYEVGIVRRFDFSSKLQRMSVLVKNVNEQYFKLYSNGSNEKIKELCRQDTIPENFTSILAKYTMKGLRVLALSMKSLKIDYFKSQKVDREKLECNMIFLGLLIVQNKLKSKTKSSIDNLHSARYRMVMATGDNILTAISVARECLLIKPEAPIYMCEIIKEGGDNKLMWNTVETFIEDDELERFKDDFKFGIEKTESSRPSKNFEPESLQIESIQSKIKEGTLGQSYIKEPSETYETDEEENIESDIFQIDINHYPFKSQAEEDYAIAISGTTFEKLVKLRNRYLIKNEEKLLQYKDLLKVVLRSGIIYARMSPDHKTLLVDCLKEENFTVCMVGDGANDCGALRTADVGVSLSLEEASIAAHFTSNVPDISCLIKLLRQGKACLVTSIQCFKYMILYSLIQFFSITLLLIMNSYLSDNQFLSSDLFIVFPLAILISSTGVYEKLTHHQPTGALISIPIISSIVFQGLVQFMCQYGVYLILSSENWYRPNLLPLDEKDDVTPCYENTVLSFLIKAIFLIANVQYLITAVAFSIGRPFKKPIYTNLSLSLFLIITFAYSYYLILSPDENSSDFFSLVEFGEEDFKYLVFIVSLLNFILSYLIEKFIVPGISEVWKRNRKSRKLSKSSLGKFGTLSMNHLYDIKEE